VSLIARNCAGSISGFGMESYRLAVEALTGIYEKKKK
jgi:3-dehydroquinate dehydratase